MNQKIGAIYNVLLIIPIMSIGVGLNHQSQNDLNHIWTINPFRGHLVIKMHFRTWQVDGSLPDHWQERANLSQLNLLGSMGFELH